MEKNSVDVTHSNVETITVTFYGDIDRDCLIKAIDVLYLNKYNTDDRKLLYVVKHHNNNRVVTFDTASAAVKYIIATYWQ